MSATILFAGDWRRRYLDAIEQAFPNSVHAAIRSALALPLARALTPSEAANAMGEAANQLELRWVERLEVNAILSSLRRQAVTEPEV